MSGGGWGMGKEMAAGLELLFWSLAPSFLPRRRTKDKGSARSALGGIGKWWGKNYHSQVFETAAVEEEEGNKEYRDLPNILYTYR